MVLKTEPPGSQLCSFLYTTLELPVKDSKRKHSSDMTTVFLFQVMKHYLTTTFSFPSVAQKFISKSRGNMWLDDQEAVSYRVNVPEDQRDKGGDQPVNN